MINLVLYFFFLKTMTCLNLPPKNLTIRKITNEAYSLSYKKT